MKSLRTAAFLGVFVLATAPGIASAGNQFKNVPKAAGIGNSKDLALDPKHNLMHKHALMAASLPKKSNLTGAHVTAKDNTRIVRPRQAAASTRRTIPARSLTARHPFRRPFCTSGTARRSATIACAGSAARAFTAPPSSARRRRSRRGTA